jgi:hypothetical protein
VRKINEKNNTRKSLRISKRGKNAGMQIKKKNRDYRGRGKLILKTEIRRTKALDKIQFLQKM